MARPKEKTAAEMTPRARLEAAWEVVLNYDGPRPDDARSSVFDGVVSDRLYQHSTGADGRRHGKAKPWSWNPGHRNPAGAYVQPSPHMHVRGDGWTSAHPGTVSAPREDDESRLMRVAGLTQEEVAVRRLQLPDPPVRLEGLTHAEISAEVSITLRQVESRIASGNRKVLELAEALRGMGTPTKERG